MSHNRISLVGSKVERRGYRAAAVPRGAPRRLHLGEGRGGSCHCTETGRQAAAE